MATTHPCTTPGCRHRTTRTARVCGPCAKTGGDQKTRAALNRYGVPYADAPRLAAALDLLERNRGALKRALDDAGVPAAGRGYQGVRRALGLLLGRELLEPQT